MELLKCVGEPEVINSAMLRQTQHSRVALYPGHFRAPEKAIFYDLTNSINLLLHVCFVSVVFPCVFPAGLVDFQENRGASSSASPPALGFVPLCLSHMGEKREKGEKGEKASLEAFSGQPLAIPVLGVPRTTSIKSLTQFPQSLPCRWVALAHREQKRVLPFRILGSEEWALASLTCHTGRAVLVYLAAPLDSYGEQGLELGSLRVLGPR